jgi:hypothetical protein
MGTNIWALLSVSFFYLLKKSAHFAVYLSHAVLFYFPFGSHLFRSQILSSSPLFLPSLLLAPLRRQLSVPLTNGVSMSPKFDSSQVVDVFVRFTDGEVGVASSLALKIEPLGLSPEKISGNIAKEMPEDWKGLRVIVKLTAQNHQAKEIDLDSLIFIYSFILYYCNVLAIDFLSSIAIVLSL